MYKVLLVDDEILDLDGLMQFIPWGELGLDVTGAVTNGFAALECMESQHIDLLITDVKMPIMTGLELYETACKKVPGLKVIFVSGYEDFQYAKKAIEMQAAAYVLKPVNDFELTEVIKTVIGKLDMERQKAVDEKRYRESTEYVRNELIRRLIEGDFNRDTMDGFMSRNELCMDYEEFNTAVIEIDDLAWKLSNGSIENPDEELKKGMDIVNAFIGSKNIELYCRIRYNRVVLLMDGRSLKVGEYLRELVEEVSTKTRLSITVGIGEAVRGSHRIKDSYEKALMALDYKMFLGKNRIIYFGDMEEDSYENAFELENKLNLLLTAVENHCMDKVGSLFYELYERVEKLKNRNKVHNFLLYTLFRIDSFLHSVNESLEHFLKDKSTHTDELLLYGTTRDIGKWLNDVIFSITGYMNEKRQKPNKKLVAEVEKYVEGNLNTRLTLKDIAEYFAFSPNYLGHIFKEETGENFSDFLIRKRLEKARMLLSDHRLKVYEVADLLGYTNYNYFSRRFKEYFKVTPSEYAGEGE